MKLADLMTEKEWQALIVEHARLHGWSGYHQFDSRRSQPGWPDLVLVRPPELLMVELKSASGKLTPEQADTLTSLAACGVETAIWRPCDETRAFARLASRLA